MGIMGTNMLHDNIAHTIIPPPPACPRLTVHRVTPVDVIDHKSWFINPCNIIPFLGLLQTQLATSCYYCKNIHAPSCVGPYAVMYAPKCVEEHCLSRHCWSWWWFQLLELFSHGEQRSTISVLLWNQWNYLTFVEV